MSPYSTLVEGLRQRVQEQGQSPAFIFRSPDHRRYELTWNSLYRLSGRFAAILNNRGLGRGHLVVNTLVNSPERVVCEVGIWLSGAASVNGHCLMADGSDLLNTIRVSRASALFVDPDVNNSPWHVLKEHVSLGENDNVTSSSLKYLKKLFFIQRTEGGGPGDFLADLENQHDWFQADDVTAADVLTVFTTSGTTGFSKLVPYTHREYIEPSASFEGNDPDRTPEVVFKTSPLGWIGGYVGSNLVNNHISVHYDVRAGGIPKDMPEFIWKTIQEEKCTMGFLSPMYLPRLIQFAKSQENSGVTEDSIASPMWKIGVIILGGLPINRAMVEAALTLAHTVIVGYGATDFSAVSLLFVTDSQSFVDHDSGPPMKGVFVKIVSEDDEDKVLDVNQVGKILVKGFARTQQYLNNPDLTIDTVFTKDGFFRTGDIGHLDERGHLIVDGRGSDAIMRGSYIFYPSWMESRIRACPGVRDVIVTGVPTPFTHEEICACVIVDSESVTLEQVRHFVEKDVVSSEEDPLSPRPRYYLEFESFPMTDTGKPRRNMIKSQATQRLRKSTAVVSNKL